MSKLGVLFVVTLYFDISLLQSLRLTSLARQTGCCTLEILSSWPPLHWGAKHMFLHLGFYVSAGGLNSGPCAYTASTLWTELSPWACELFSSPFGHFSRVWIPLIVTGVTQPWLLSSFMTAEHGIM